MMLSISVDELLDAGLFFWMLSRVFWVSEGSWAKAACQQLTAGWAMVKE
jgi:hypothetical protein